MDDNGWKAVFAGICAIIFFSFVAYSFPGMFTGLASNSGNLVPVGNLFVQSGVLLAIDGTAGTAVTWPVGTYSACTISTISTNCLNTNSAPNTINAIYSPFLILFAIIAILFTILMMILFARKALGED